MKIMTSKSNKTKTIFMNSDDVKPTLKQLQEMVGGYIEVVYAENGDQIILDEEGINGITIPQILLETQ